LQSLVYELQRSIDFHHREEPGAARIGSMLLCVDVDQVSGLEGYLQRALNLPVTLCDPFKGILYSDTQFNPEYLHHVGPAFAPAVGLALRALEEVPQAPSLDLSITGAESRMAKSAPRRLMWALGISILLVIITAIASFSLGRVLKQRQDELDRAKADLERVIQLEQESTTAARRAKEALSIVQVRGLPWSDILFQISEFRPKEVWFVNLSTDSSNVLSLTGSAFTADSVATLMDSLTQSELFTMPDRTYIQKDTSEGRLLVKFQIKVQVTPPKAPAPAVAPATAAGPASTSPKPAGGTQ
jgi:Tfp pilus assembly protein PilN